MGFIYDLLLHNLKTLRNRKKNVNEIVQNIHKLIKNEKWQQKQFMKSTITTQVMEKETL